MRLFRRALLIAGGSAVAILAASIAAFLALYLPASAEVSSALSEVPPELRPPPDLFFEAAICVHHHGVGHLAARQLLTADGLNRTRAITWAARYFVWTQAVERRSSDEVMALFANHIHHSEGSGLVSGARAYFAKSPAELTRAEALELVIADAYPKATPPDRLEFLRRSCS